ILKEKIWLDGPCFALRKESGALVKIEFNKPKNAGFYWQNWLFLGFIGLSESGYLMVIDLLAEVKIPSSSWPFSLTSFTVTVCFPTGRFLSPTGNNSDVLCCWPSTSIANFSPSSLRPPPI